MWSFDSEEKARLCNIKNLIVLAMADGTVHPNELALIATIAERDDISEDRVRNILAGKEKVEFTVPEDDETKLIYLKDMVYVMMVDGEIDDKELAWCKIVADQFGFRQEVIDALILDIVEELKQGFAEQTSNSSFLSNLLSGSNSPTKGEYIFHSNTHQRYENGNPVKGEQVGCNRDVVIEKNISGNVGYSVKIVVPNAEGSFFGTPMSTKPMKIERTTSRTIELRGYGYDRNAVSMGVPMSDASFESYGMTLYHNGSEIQKCTLHMFDRNVDIEYYIK